MFLRNIVVHKYFQFYDQQLFQEKLRCTRSNVKTKVDTMQSTHQETHFQATIHAYGVSSSNSFFDSLRKQQFDFVDTTHIFSRVCLELVPVFDAFVLCAVEYVCDLIQKCVDVKFITNLILSSPPSFWVCSLIIQLLQYCNGKVSNFDINYIGQYESGIT